MKPVRCMFYYSFTTLDWALIRLSNFSIDRHFDFEVSFLYRKQDGVNDVHYIKRTHRQKDFNVVKEGELPVRLTKNMGKVSETDV